MMTGEALSGGLPASEPERSRPSPVCPLALTASLGSMQSLLWPKSTWQREGTPHQLCPAPHPTNHHLVTAPRGAMAIQHRSLRGLHLLPPHWDSLGILPTRTELFLGKSSHPLSISLCPGGRSGQCPGGSGPLLPGQVTQTYPFPPAPSTAGQMSQSPHIRGCQSAWDRDLCLPESKIKVPLLRRRVLKARLGSNRRQVPEPWRAGGRPEGGSERRAGQGVAGSGMGTSLSC